MYTKGPWEYEKCRCGQKGCSSYRIKHPGADGMFSEDNARLIAAAPELLEALKEVIGYLSRYENCGEFNRATAAIEKAEGK